MRRQVSIDEVKKQIIKCADEYHTDRIEQLLETYERMLYRKAQGAMLKQFVEDEKAEKEYHRMYEM